MVQKHKYLYYLSHQYRLDNVTGIGIKYYKAIVQKWVPYSQRYLLNAIPDIPDNHNANPTNPNRYSKRNPNPTNPNTRYRCE